MIRGYNMNRIAYFGSVQYPQVTFVIIHSAIGTRIILDIDTSNRYTQRTAIHPIGIMRQSSIVILKDSASVGSDIEMICILRINSDTYRINGPTPAIILIYAQIPRRNTGPLLSVVYIDTRIAIKLRSPSTANSSIHAIMRGAQEITEVTIRTTGDVPLVALAIQTHQTFLFLRQPILILRIDRIVRYIIGRKSFQLILIRDTE